MESAITVKGQATDLPPAFVHVRIRQASSTVAAGAVGKWETPEANAEAFSKADKLVIIEEPQPAQRVEGIVLDIQGQPIPDVTVTDRTEDGSAILRSTKTDAKGHFHFSKQRGKTIYTLRFDHPLWNPLQLSLKLDRHAAARGIIARPHIGG